MKFKSFEEIPNQETSEVVEETSTEKKEPTKESLPKQAGRVDRRGFEKSREEVFDKDELDKMSDAELAERAIFAAVENPTMGKENHETRQPKSRGFPKSETRQRRRAKKQQKSRLTKRPPSGGFLLYFTMHGKILARHSKYQI